MAAERAGLHIVNRGVDAVAGDVHATGGLVEVSLPATEVIEAEALEAKLETTLVADKLAHLLRVGSTLVKIGVVGDAERTLADSLHDIVSRISVSAVACRAPRQQL